jgi:hypothetical protein
MNLNSHCWSAVTILFGFERNSTGISLPKALSLHKDLGLLYLGLEKTMTQVLITESMQSHATAGVFWAREMFGISLNYSEESLHDVEGILLKLRDRLPKHKLDRFLKGRVVRRESLEIAIVWGSYVGEVIRRQWNGEWTTGNLKKSKLLLTPLQVQDITLFPIEKIYLWLGQQRDGGLWEYYQSITQALQTSSSSPLPLEDWDGSSLPLSLPT